MKVTCYLCGDMCFDNCKNESKEMIEHYENSYSHKVNKGKGFGVYHLYGDDFDVRLFVGRNIKEVKEIIESCGGYIP